MFFKVAGWAQSISIVCEKSEAMVLSLFARKKRHASASLDIGVLNQVVDSGDEAACRKLADQLVDFMGDASTSPEERQLVMPVLARLACHPLRSVRAHFARRAIALPQLDSEVVFAIAADEEDISLPFIRHAACMTPTLQEAIFRAGDMQRRQTVCAREDVAPQVVALALEGGVRALVMAVLGNPHAAMPADLARQVYVRFRQDEEVIAALLKRDDLPLEVRLAHVEVVSGRLREVMNRSEWRSARQAVELASTLEEQALVEILADARTEEELHTAFRFLVRRGRLTAAVLLRAACAGHVAVLVHALAWLARMKPARIIAALRPETSLGVVRAALARTTLPQGADALVLAVMLAARTHGEEAAKTGVCLAGFAPLVLETLAETEQLGVSEKMQAAAMLQRVSDARTRELAARFLHSLLRHAA